ncbi:MAG: hypothetical protein ACLFUR_01740 [Candidatus Hadarchaeia archaeon]
MDTEKRDLDRVYDLFERGYAPLPAKILIVLFSVLFSPILFLIDQISKRSDKRD